MKLWSSVINSSFIFTVPRNMAWNRILPKPLPRWNLFDSRVFPWGRCSWRLQYSSGKPDVRWNLWNCCPSWKWCQVGCHFPHCRYQWWVFFYNYGGRLRCGSITSHLFQGIESYVHETARYNLCTIISMSLFFFSETTNTDYWVIATDYNSYSLVYSCSNINDYQQQGKF